MYLEIGGIAFVFDEFVQSPPHLTMAERIQYRFDQLSSVKNSVSGSRIRREDRRHLRCLRVHQRRAPAPQTLSNEITETLVDAIRCCLTLGEKAFDHYVETVENRLGRRKAPESDLFDSVATSSVSSASYWTGESHY
jgi:hypothetical protein